MKKVLIVFGTRPEAIKMAPVVKAFQNESSTFDTKVCVTAQHREMLDQVLELFEIKPDFDLDIMKSGQDLYDITSRILLNIRDVLIEFEPDIVLVHGDTTTTMATSLASFYHINSSGSRVLVGHVEAGLRTHNIYSPWPEEANRQITGILANYHFAPTDISKNNLLQEGKDKNSIIVTGNTVIDALYLALNKIKNSKELEDRIVKRLKTKLQKNAFKQSENAYQNSQFSIINSKFILVTGHRRENFGEGFLNICKALKEIALENSDIDIIYPVHLNPNVQKPVYELLSEVKNIHLIEPLQYEEFIYLMDKSYFIITDSGGVQEEAPSLGKPVLVMRDTTERPEALKAGTVKLVGTDINKIVKYSQLLLNNKEEYELMSKAHNPYGDGKAAQKIKDFLKLKVEN